MNQLNLPFSIYKPGRFTYLMNEPFIPPLWEYLSSASTVELMLKAINDNKPAIYYLLEKIENNFESQLKSTLYPSEEISTLINNMILQIIEFQGCIHVACGLCPQARFIKSSGIYKKR